MEEAIIILLGIGHFEIDPLKGRHFSDIIEANEYIGQIKNKKIILVVDYFTFMEFIDDINSFYRSEENIIRVLLFPDEMSKEIQEFQNSKSSFDAVLPLPFDVNLIEQVTQDFTNLEVSKSFLESSTLATDENKESADVDVQTEPNIEPVMEQNMSTDSKDDNQKHEISLAFNIDDLSDSEVDQDYSESSDKSENVESFENAENSENSDTQKTIVFSQADFSHEQSSDSDISCDQSLGNIEVDLESELEEDTASESFSLDEDISSNISFNVDASENVDSDFVSPPVLDDSENDDLSLSLDDDLIKIDEDPIVDEISCDVPLSDETSSFCEDKSEFDLANNDKTSELDPVEEVRDADKTSEIINPIDSFEHNDEFSMASEVSYNEITRVQGTLRAMRLERNKLLSEVEKFQKKLELVERENLTVVSENEELKIELSIIKKRYKDESQNAKNDLQMSEERRDLIEARYNELKNDKIKVGDKIRVDMEQVKRRERELENKLELITIDSQHQIQNREKIILELKRKVDALEFSIENSTITQQRAVDLKSKSVHKVNQAVKALKSTLIALESEEDDVLVDLDKQI